MYLIDTSFSRINQVFKVCIFTILLFTAPQMVYSQSPPKRIHYAGRDIFLSGINIAWVNFANDLGSFANMTQFRNIFKEIHNNGGNVLRFWLFTDGTNTPEYNANGYVTGPGSVAIPTLQKILDTAQQCNVGLILCLWSHDMLKKALSTEVKTRNVNLLTDTSYMHAFIKNALIPIVDAVKGHPAIASWEIFNEPEGFTNELGWSDRLHIPMDNVQGAVNLMAGAIHRTDPNTFVTSSANTFQSLTDVNYPSTKISGLRKISALSLAQQNNIVDEFNVRNRSDLTVDEYLDYLSKLDAVNNYNYYKDDRLVAMGHDNLGTLDFYCVHYYAQGEDISSFVHPASYWGLDKPIVLAEFYMQPTDGIDEQSLYPWLYSNGYAGAMSWQWWGDTKVNDDAKNGNHSRTLISLQYMFKNYRNDVIIDPTTGSIYAFSATPTTIEKTEITNLVWDVEPGSTVTLDGNSVSVKDTFKITPLATTTYTLAATGQVSQTATATVTVLPSGKILAFKAVPAHIGTGENTSLIWHVVKSSTVTMNGYIVPVVDTMIFYPDAAYNTYTLRAEGDIRDSLTITIPVFSADQVDRAFGAEVSVTTNDTQTYSLSSAQNIVDGDTISRWQAAASPTAQTVRLDLGRIFTIDKIIIHWGIQAFASYYNILTSEDLSVYSLLKSVSSTGGTNYIETLSGLNGSGRYLSFNLVTKGKGAYSIAEINVYGVPIVVGVKKTDGVIPFTYSISQNYPNPFNPETTIQYSLAAPEQVKLTVFDILGRQVATLIDKKQGSGFHSVLFNAGKLASGIYFYRIAAGSFFEVKKMIFIK